MNSEDSLSNSKRQYVLVTAIALIIKMHVDEKHTITNTAFLNNPK